MPSLSLPELNLQEYQKSAADMPLSYDQMVMGAVIVVVAPPMPNPEDEEKNASSAVVADGSDDERHAVIHLNRAS